MNNLFFGLSVMAVGMIVVFLGLVILIGCIWLLTRFTGQHRGKKPAPEKERCSRRQRKRFLRRKRSPRRMTV